MTIFYLVRHGTCERRPGDAPLTAHGYNEAQSAAGFLAERPIRAVYSSPLRRCVETAHSLAERHGLRVTVDERLRERANWGDLPGQSLEEFAAMWKRATADRMHVPPIGDSSCAAGERFDAALHAIHQVYSDDEIVIATHGGVTTDFLRNHYSAAELAVRNAQYEHMAECSITTLHFDGKEWVLETLASASHLPAKG